MTVTNVNNNNSYSGDFISPEFFEDITHILDDSFISPELNAQLDSLGELNSLQTTLTGLEQSRFMVLTSELRTVSVFEKICDFVRSFFSNDLASFNKKYGEDEIKNKILTLLNKCIKNNVQVNSDLVRLLMPFQTQRISALLLSSNPLAVADHQPEVEMREISAEDVLDMSVDPHAVFPESELDNQ